MIGLYPHCGFLSETSRMLAIWRALRERNVPATMATHGGPHEAVLKAEGVPYRLLEPTMDAARCAAFIGALPGIGPAGRSPYSDDEIRASVAAEAAQMREDGIELAVTGFTLTTLISTRVVGIPLAASHAGSFVPPLAERGLIAAPSRPVKPIFAILPKRLQRALINRAPERIKDYCSGFNRVAKELGVEGIPSFAALLLADLTLVTDVPEVLGLSREEVDGWRPKRPQAYRKGTTMRLVGPIYARLDLPIPDRVARFMDEGPFVYVAMTSVSAGLLAAVIAAVRRAGRRILAVSTVHDLRHLEGPGLMVEPFLPSHLVMPRAELVVAAAGQGTAQTAAASGVPLIGVPLHPEQDLNIARLEELGMATRMPLRHAGGPRMTAAVEAMLADPSRREAARRLEGWVAGVDGAAGAAEAIVAYLAERRRPVASAA